MESLKQEPLSQNQNTSNNKSYYISNESDQGFDITDRQENIQESNSLENFKQESEIYSESTNMPYLNYGLFNKEEIYNTDTSQKAQSHEDIKFKNTEQSKLYPGEKPWLRATRDPNVIQKGTELFVGNLSMDTNEEDIYDNFREFGEIIDVNYIL